MDYDKLIAPAAEAMRPSGIRKFTYSSAISGE